MQNAQNLFDQWLLPATLRISCHETSSPRPVVHQGHDLALARPPLQSSFGRLMALRPLCLGCESIDQTDSQDPPRSPTLNRLQVGGKRAGGETGRRENEITPLSTSRLSLKRPLRTEAPRHPGKSFFVRSRGASVRLCAPGVPCKKRAASSLRRFTLVVPDPAYA